MTEGEFARLEPGPSDFVFAGPYELSASAAEALGRALRLGCTVFGFATRGCDGLFGIKRGAELAQPGGDFGLNGYFRLESKYAREYLPFPDGDAPLPVFSGAVRLEMRGATPLGNITLTAGETAVGLTRFQNGAGIGYYFGFDLPKTLWTSSAGKPVHGGSASFPVGRVPDSRIVPLGYDTTVAYGDYYISILQSILARMGGPMIHRLPLDRGEIPDYLIYFAGDDDAASGEMDMLASEIMHDKGLPYHMNLMINGAGDFVVSREQYAIIKGRGHELSLHYDFTGGNFTKAGFAEQYGRYVAAFGEEPVCTVGHCLVHEGWAERCRYQAELGISGDNGKSGEIDPRDINAFNMHGYAFGTAYPFFARDDWEHGNRRLKFVELPVSYYEPRLSEGDTAARDKLRACADRSAYFGRTLNLFLHPHYVTGRYNNTPPGAPNPALSAVDEILDYSAARGYKVMLCGPDKLCKWWHERGESSVSEAGSVDGVKKYTADCRCADGMAIKIPITENGCAPEVYIGDEKTECTEKTIDGLDWLLLPIKKAGKYEISIR